MLLETALIPQADLIWDVARVPSAVQQGITTTTALSVYLGNKGPRQGRYYLRAARILGLVADDASSDSITLTTYGHVLLTHDREGQCRLLRQGLEQCEPTKTIIQTLQIQDGLTKAHIAEILQSLAPLSENTADRRAATMCAWLRDLDIAFWKQNRMHYIAPPIPVTDFRADQALPIRIQA